MPKTTVCTSLWRLFLLSVVCYGCCKSADKDWSLGCYKQTTASSCFNITAGDYDPLVNLTGEACVSACSALNISARFAGLTVNGVCLCSQLEEICLKQTANTSCSYPRGDGGFYYKVFPVAEMPTMDAPKSVVTFNTFNVTIRSADPNCTYTLDLDDGVRKALSSNSSEIITTHYFVNVGEYKIKLSAEPKCMPRVITAIVRSSDTTFGNASFDCGDKPIEVTSQKTSCQLEVVRGFSLNVTNASGDFLATLPDTVVESISLPAPDVGASWRSTRSIPNGTYVMPLLSAASDGYLLGIEFPIISDVDVTIQILSPKCPDVKIPCRGGCIPVSDGCPFQTRSENEMLSESYSPDVLTYSGSSASYTVSEEFKINFVNDPNSRYTYLSNPVAMKQGDILAFHIPSTSVILADRDVSHGYWYYNQSFAKGNLVDLSNAAMRNFSYIWFRVHVSIPVVLDIPFTPKIPSVSMTVIVTSFTTLEKVLEDSVEVQERISGLNILKPSVGEYHVNLKNIPFEFNVSKGTNVTYSIDLGDRSNSINTSSKSLIHQYRDAGNYTFTVTAFNDVSSVNASQIVIVVIDVKNLKFIDDPKDHPGEVGKEYDVSFLLEFGTRPIFQIDFGNNMSVFMACANSLVNRTIPVNTTYEETGTYNISVTAHGLAAKSFVKINSSVEIMQEIRNLTVLYKNAEGKDVTIEDNFIKEHYPNKPIILHANVLSGWPVNFIFHANDTGEGVKTGNGYRITIREPTEGRLAIIMIIAKNNLNSENCTIRINVLSNCDSKIMVIDPRTKDDPFRTTLGHEIRINTEEDKKLGESCDKDCWKFNWTLFYANGTTVSGVKYNKEKSSFLIEKGGIKDPKLYKVKMVATCNDSRRTNQKSEDESYFEVKANNPVANILGGYKRTVRRNDEITLDASESSNIQLHSSTGLRFNWSCVANCSTVDIFNETDASRVTINSSSLGGVKTFKVMVEVTTEFRKVDSATQVIHFVNESYPTTFITCRVNCKAKVNPVDRLSLEGKCTSADGKCNGSVSFEWTVFKNETTMNRILNTTTLKTTTGFKKENLVLAPNTLTRNTKYYVELKATFKGFSSLSFYQFQTAGVLTEEGKCEINHQNGIAASTDFQVKCSGWEDVKRPLIYKVRYKSSVVVETTVSTIEDEKEGEWILWYQGVNRETPKNKLPASLNGSIAIIVEITDDYGGYVKKTLSVQVKQQNQTEFSQSLENLKESKKEKDPQQLTQYVISLSQNLNNKKTDSKEDSEKHRQTLVEVLEDVKVNEVPLIEQAADALILATDNSTQVNHETQESGAKLLKRMSESLWNITSSPNERSGQEIDKTGGKLLTSFSKMLNASLFTGRNTTKEDAPKKVKPNLYGTLSKEGSDLKKTGEETEKVVEKLDESMKLITAAIAKRKLVGEEPTIIETPKFKVKLSKASPDWDDGRVRFNGSDINVNHSYAQPWISLPRSGLQKLESKTGNILIETITFEDNPYTWDIKHSLYIQPNVFSFTLRDERGEKKSVQNLSQEIEIRLPNNKKNIVYTRLNKSAENQDFLLFSFEVDEYHYDETIMIHIKSSKRMHKHAKIYIKYGAKVSLTNYNFKHQLSEDCQRCSDSLVDIQRHDESSVVFIRDPKKVKSAKGIVSVGVLPCPDKDNTKPECDTKDPQFSSFVQTVSCRYWSSPEWKKDGCTVGRNSTPLQSSCLCNHLTAFSSYIVKPNPLNKFSVDDFKQGYVSFVAVIVIFLLYFISLVWARRADRSDFTKVGVCGLADNGPHDRYRYEIAIWTGMRRNAGTSSEVNIILSGEKNDSEPRCLVNPQNPNFARGSLEKFLLTSSKDIGSLYCIRVWHDNSKGSWYLSRVMVTDLQKDERYYFICDRWLAVDEDDGQVERLLPVASDEELADFHHLFYSKAKRGLSDTHLWVSVLNRPPQSIFTRVQRLSCCLCIIMTTMLANAMFYQTRSEPTADTTNFIGSYSFTWDQVYIGVVSSLIIVPINVIILNIFRNVRPKSRKVRRQSKISMGNIGPAYDHIRSSNTSFETLPESSDQGTRTSVAVGAMNVYSRPPSSELRKKRAEKLSRWARFKRFIIPSSLPHWFVYVGWVILVVVTLGSATVVVLYGMQFGNGRSLQWLLSIFISIAEDIFVLQPLKVLVFALAFALLVQKPDEGEFESSGDFNDDEVEQVDILGSQNSIPEKKRVSSSPRLPMRPTEEQLAVMRKARLKERKMLFLIQEITVHLIFTIVIALVTYGHKDYRSVYLYRHIDELSRTTDKLNNFPQFWNWSRAVLVPKAFPEKLYNGRDVPTYGFFDDGYNNLISRARMRLLRVKTDSCKVAKEFKQEGEAPKIACLEDYSIFNQDEACYRSRWHLRNEGEKSEKKDHWCFQNWKDLDGYPTWGTFTTYSGSGYIKELRPGDDNNQIVSDLESHQWLDNQARALFVEMTTYNANINLYTSITLLFEFPEFGGVFYFRNISPMRLKVYVGGFAFFILACEVVFALFILGYFYIALKKFYRQKMAYFKEFWNVMDFAILVSSFAAIGVYAYRIGLTSELMKRVPERNGEFVNFQYVTYWNEVLNCIIALVVALTTVKLTKLMRFNLRISLFGKTLQDAKHALAGFSIQFGIVFFAYVMVGVLVFGYNVSQFRSIHSGMMALGRVILGKSQFRELFTADPIIGPLFFLSYVMFVCWILVTMFVAILNDSYHEVQDKCFGMSNEYEIIDFLLARLRAWSGLGSKTKKNPIPADQRWRQAGIKAKAAATLGRQRSYKPSDENIALEKTGDLMERFEDSIRSLENRVYHLSAHLQ